MPIQKCTVTTVDLDKCMLIFSSRLCLRSLLLRHAKLGLEGLGHGGGRGAGQAELDLDSVIDEPLESGEGSDHDNSGSESSPHALQNVNVRSDCVEE